MPWPHRKHSCAPNCWVTEGIFYNCWCFELRLIRFWCAAKSCRKLSAVMTKRVLKNIFVAVIGTLTQRFVFFMLFYSVLFKTNDCDLSFCLWNVRFQGDVSRSKSSHLWNCNQRVCSVLFLCFSTQIITKLQINYGNKLAVSFLIDWWTEIIMSTGHQISIGSWNSVFFMSKLNFCRFVKAAYWRYNISVECFGSIVVFCGILRAWEAEKWPELMEERDPWAVWKVFTPQWR